MITLRVCTYIQSLFERYPFSFNQLPEFLLEGTTSMNLHCLFSFGYNGGTIMLSIPSENCSLIFLYIRNPPSLFLLKYQSSWYYYLFFYFGKKEEFGE